MDSTGTTVVVAGLALVAVAGLARLLRAMKSRRAARGGWFSGCLPLFDEVRIAETDHGFSRLNGRYRGRLFDLQAVPDTLTYRKLPTLWLLVTIPEEMPLAGTLDLMVRPTGTDVFSRFGTLPVRIETPPGFPPDTAIRSDRDDLVLTPDIAARLPTAFFSARVKELVLSPRGLRLVWLAEEADRGRYLIFRDSEMGMTPLAPAILRPLLDQLVDLADAVATKETP